MGLLDTILGAVKGAVGQQQAQGDSGSGSGSGASAGAGLGLGAGGLGGIISMVAGNPQMLSVITGMLGNDGTHGGLGGLASKFQGAGLGHVMDSWTGSGDNHAISGDQISNVLGSDAVGNIASKLGVSNGDAAGQLAQILPGLINHMTPQGQAPEGGLGNSGDLMGMLGGLLRK